MFWNASSNSSLIPCVLSLLKKPLLSKKACPTMGTTVLVVTVFLCESKKNTLSPEPSSTSNTSRARTILRLLRRRFGAEVEAFAG